MHKLYFKYGTMGSSKSAQALMCKFNYEQRGMKVFLLKPSIDSRDENFVKSRIGIKCPCYLFSSSENLMELCKNITADVFIIDEAQFLTKAQVDQLKMLTKKAPVLCYGLLTNFKTQLFEGSKRLVEISDSMQEIKSVCACGRKATVNARISNGKIVKDGDEIVIGGDESYVNLCYTCYHNNIVH